MKTNFLKSKTNGGPTRGATTVGAAITRMTALLDNENGRIGIPILLYFLGVPGIIVLLLWAVFFRG